MDRFYLPAAPDPLVSIAFFDLIAGIYDRLTTPAVNISTAIELLKAVLPRDGPARILDFGCGTGFAREAVRGLDVKCRPIYLVGE